MGTSPSFITLIMTRLINHDDARMPMIQMMVIILLNHNCTIRNTVDKYPGKLAWVDHMHRKWT